MTTHRVRARIAELDVEQSATHTRTIRLRDASAAMHDPFAPPPGKAEQVRVTQADDRSRAALSAPSRDVTYALWEKEE